MKQPRHSNGVVVEASSSAPRRARRIMWVLGLVVILLLGLTVTSATRILVAQPYGVASDSMEPTLPVGSSVLAYKLTTPERGDVVVFNDVHNWAHRDTVTTPWWRQVTDAVGITPDESHIHLVKRVIGLPGDKVVSDHGKLSVNGQPIEEPVAVEQSVDFEVVVPAGNLMVAGDNRATSIDSRCALDTPSAAFIPESEVVGVGVLSEWSTVQKPHDWTLVPTFSSPAPEHAEVVHFDSEHRC